MCKDTNIKASIKNLDFTKHYGKMTVYLTDGREMIVPLSFFPDIKKLSLKKREEWMVLDDQFFTFAGLSNVYSINDVMRV